MKAEEEGRQLTEKRQVRAQWASVSWEGVLHPLRVLKLAGRAYHKLVPWLYFITAAEYQVTSEKRKSEWEELKERELYAFKATSQRNHTGYV